MRRTFAAPRSSQPSRSEATHAHAIPAAAIAEIRRSAKGWGSTVSTGASERLTTAGASDSEADATGWGVETNSAGRMARGTGAHAFTAGTSNSASSVASQTT